MVYIINGFLYRNSEFKEEDLITINKEFRNKDNRKAREEAFSYFNSIIEVLLESKGIAYKNDIQAEKHLEVFYFSDISEQHPKLQFVTYNNDIDKLLTVSFTMDDNPSVTKTGIKIYDNEYIIKAIGNESGLLENKIKQNLKIENQIINYEAKRI